MDFLTVEEQIKWRYPMLPDWMESVIEEVNPITEQDIVQPNWLKSLRDPNKFITIRANWQMTQRIISLEQFMQCLRNEIEYQESNEFLILKKEQLVLENEFQRKLFWHVSGDDCKEFKRLPVDLMDFQYICLDIIRDLHNKENGLRKRIKTLFNKNEYILNIEWINKQLIEYRKSRELYFIKSLPMNMVLLQNLCWSIKDDIINHEKELRKNIKLYLKRRKPKLNNITSYNSEIKRYEIERHYRLEKGDPAETRRRLQENIQKLKHIK